MGAFLGIALIVIFFVLMQILYAQEEAKIFELWDKYTDEKDQQILHVDKSILFTDKAKHITLTKKAPN